MKPNWERFEEWLAESWCDVGTGSTAPASGARWHTKQDVRGQKMYKFVLVQAKSGDKGARVTREDLDRLVADAAKEGRRPYVAVAVGDLAFVGEIVVWR